MSGEDVHRCLLGGEQVQADDGLVVGGPGARPQGHGGEQAGLGLDGQVGLETVLAVAAGLVHVPRMGIDDRDHPDRCGAVHDAPASVASVGPVGRFDVLTCDQGQ
ncbi:hypothetical protein [Spirillospora sp. NPDC048819]|uniref:hypothetical protein n=1 Tax=Spirillospora sp. NPDC048819 TaxID=3155268 RepID=UPI0033E5A75A